MAAVIEAVHTCFSRRWIRRHSSIDLAVRAARGALEQAGRRPDDLDLLVNTGVYRDGNVCEPAIASLVQRAIGANGARPSPSEAGTFSFDLSDGGCGLLAGAQVVDGFLRSGSIRSGLVVTSDVDPTPAVSEGYSFLPAGAAMLLRPGRGREGFAYFHSESFGKYAHLFESRLRWNGEPERISARVGRARHALSIRESEEFLDRCVDCAEAALSGFLSRTALCLSDLDLIIPSCSPAGFPRELGQRARVPEHKIADVSASFGSVHTAGLALALEAAVADGRFASARNVLFVTVGAGITVSLALYVKEPESSST